MKIKEVKKKLEKIGYKTEFNGDDLLDASLETEASCFSVVYNEDENVTGIMLDGVGGFLSIDFEPKKFVFHKSK